MGIDHDTEIKKYDSSLLLDLAGNAFHSGCCGAMMLAMLFAMGFALRRKLDAPLPQNVVLSGAAAPQADAEMSATDAAAALDGLWSG